MLEFSKPWFSCHKKNIFSAFLLGVQRSSSEEPRRSNLMSLQPASEADPSSLVRARGVTSVVAANYEAAQLWKRKASAKKEEDDYSHANEGGNRWPRPRPQRPRSSSSVGGERMNKRKERPQWRRRKKRKENECEKMLDLYIRVERCVDAALGILSAASDSTCQRKGRDDFDDMHRRSLRDADRNLERILPVEEMPLGAAELPRNYFPFLVSSHFYSQKSESLTKASYLWTNTENPRYKSRFLPMRTPDLVRDDLAFRSHVH